MSARAPSRIPNSALAIVPPIPAEHQVRTFDKIGSGIVDIADVTWGKDPAEFSPEEYAHYAALSSYVYAAVRIRATNLGQLPITLWKTRGGEDVEVTSGGPGSLWSLMHTINPFWSTRRWIRMIEWSRCLQGAAFTYLNRGKSGRGTPTELWWIRPDRMRVVPHPDKYIAGYLHEGTNGGAPVPFLPGEVLWMPMDNPIDEFAGLSPIASVRLSIDSANDAMRSNRNIHRNGTRISGIVSPNNADTPFSKQQHAEVAALFGELYRGVEQAHKLAVVSHPIKVERLTMTPEDAQYIEQLRWTLGDVARAFGVPAEKLQDREHSTYNNVKQADKSFWQDTLIPEADDISDYLTEFLVPLFPGECDKVRLDYSSVLAVQEDMTELTTQAQAWYGMGVPLNALLTEYAPQLLPKSGAYEWGDLPKQSSMTPDAVNEDALAAESVKAQAAEDAEAARMALALVRQLRALPAPQTRAIEYGSDEHRLLMRRAERVMDRGERAVQRELRRLFLRQQESVLARLRKRRALDVMADIYNRELPDGVEPMKRDDDETAAAPFDVEQWTETFTQALMPIMQEIVEDAGAQVFDDLKVIGVFDIENPLISQWLEQAVLQFAGDVNATTIEALRDVLQTGIDNGLSIDELAEQIKSVFAEANDVRATTIARTEATRATNAGGLEAARQSGVVSGKVWLSALDPRTRDSHLAAHGQQRGLEEPFDLGGVALQFPGDRSMSPPASETVNCRCTLTWVLKD